MKKQEKLSKAFGTMLKLQFDSIDLVGRENEKQVLLDCLQRILPSNDGDDDGKDRPPSSSPAKNTTNIILLSGASGTGKTALAETLVAPLKRARGTFVKAKYDLKLQDAEPYSGISVACNETCRYFMETSSLEEKASIRDALRDTIEKSQLELLASVVPMLADLTAESSSEEEQSTNIICASLLTRSSQIDPDTCTQSSSSTKRGGGGRRRSIFRRRSRVIDDDDQTRSTVSGSAMDRNDAKVVLLLAFSRLFQILASRLKPLVVFLDDLQWADVQSLELIETLVKDQNINGRMMVIGCYRSDEVDEKHSLSKTIRTLKGDNTELKEIYVGLLSVDAVNMYLQDLLSASNPEKTKGLAKICHRRTMGNIFFIRVFLTSLYDSSLLEYNTNIFQWTWDDKCIDSKTAATDNLISLLVSKMNNFDDGFQWLLKVASRLGHSFERHVILLLWERIGTQKTERRVDQVDRLLQLAVDEKFFEAMDANASFRFVHDKVQEAAASLIAKSERESFHKEIGRCLYTELAEEKLEQMLFVVVDLLNSTSNDQHSRDVITLNISAATRSMDLSAFMAATRYVEHGIEQLQRGIQRVDSIWEDDFALSLHLHTMGAEAEASLGHSEKAEWYCREVIRQDKALPAEKLPLYKVLVELLHGLGRDGETVALSLEILGELGYKYPKSKRMQRLKADRYLKETKAKFLPKPQKVAKMPMSTDPTVRETIRFFAAALPQMSSQREMSLYVLISCDAVRLTKEHGLTEFSGSTFVSFANVLMHRREDWSTAQEIAEIAQTIQKRLSSNYTKTSTILKLNSLIFAWTKPLKSILSQLMEGYRVGILSGNIDGGCLCITFFIVAQLMSGSPLQVVLDDMAVYSPQLRTLRVSYIADIFDLCIATDLKELVGNNDTSSKHSTNVKSGFLVDLHAKLYKVLSLAHLGKYEEGAKLSMTMGDDVYDPLQGLFYTAYFELPRAICVYGAAVSETKQNKKNYLQAAERIRKRLKAFVQRGGVNFLHHLYLLDAEDAALRRKDAVAKKAYEDSIQAGARSGFIQDAGLANERYALYLASRKDIQAARDRYNESIKYYTEWGAHHKVALLQQALKSLDHYPC
ncbi:MAG: hypothetical protein SGILL_000928 [Bacillariaceae sp.]